MQIPVAHVEASLRSFDRSMPEELNRVLTDHFSDLLFTSEPSGNQNLAREVILEEKIRFVGNTMIDTLAAMLPRTDEGQILKELGLCDSRNGGAEIADKSAPARTTYVLATLHRPQNVDDSAALNELLTALEEIAQDVPVLFPVHPRTRRRIEENHLSVRPGRMRLLEPLGYLDFLTLMRFAALVMTDSGGIQEETTYLAVPCLTVRPNTERPVTIDLGTNRLIKRNEAEIVEASREALCGGQFRRLQLPPLWDGRAAERIVDHLERP
jgi:UDP-N-acetylglucosamine 2-epimerase (non-hydrolysing)